MKSLLSRRGVSPSYRPSLVEQLESRQLLSSYFISTDAQYPALSSKKFVAGDQILLKGGTTFHGELYLDSGDTGSASNPILIGTYDPTTKKQISDTAAASARATISAGKTDAIFAWDTAGVNIRGLNIVGSGATTNKGCGIQLYNDKSGNVKLSGVTIDHVDVSGFGDYGIQFGGGNGKSGFSNVSITNSNVHNNNYGGINSYGVFSATSTLYANTNVYIGHVNAYNNLGTAGINGPVGNGIYLSDVGTAKIEFCRAYGNGQNCTSPTGPEGIWVYDSNAVTIQYNESYNNHSNGADGGGFDVDGGCSNCVMQYNYSHDNAGFGFGLYQFSGQRKWTNNTVYNNVSANNGTNGGNGSIEVFLWTSGPSMTNAKIGVNTLVVKNKATAFIDMVQSNVTATFWSNIIQVGGTVNAKAVGLSAV